MSELILIHCKSILFALQVPVLLQNVDKCTVWSYAPKQQIYSKLKLLYNSIFSYIFVFLSLYHICTHECPFVETIDEIDLSKH